MLVSSWFPILSLPGFPFLKKYPGCWSGEKWLSSCGSWALKPRLTSYTHFHSHSLYLALNKHTANCPFCSHEHFEVRLLGYWNRSRHPRQEMSPVWKTANGFIYPINCSTSFFFFFFFPLLIYTHYPVVHSSLTLTLNFSHFLLFSAFLSTFPIISEISKSLDCIWFLPPT